MQQPTIGIIGVGMVGGAVYAYYPDAIPYDIVKYPENKERIQEADIIFIAVPTPFKKEGKGFDLSAVEDAFQHIPGEKIVVLKSTVWPGTTEAFQEKYPQHKIIFNPEFLREVSAKEDFAKPDRQIVGYTEKSRDVTEMIMEMLPPAPFKKIVPARDAEMAKYFGNTFLASKVIFANQMYDLCDAIEADYSTVQEIVAADPRIGPSHLDVWHGGYRGYGGACFPKDTRALIQFAEEKGVDMEILKLMEEINYRLTGGVDR